MTDKPIAPGIIKRMERDGIPRTIAEVHEMASQIFALLEEMDARKPNLKLIQGDKK